MNVKSPEIFANTQRVVKGQVCEVLFTEYQHFTLRGQQRKLITPGRGEATELNTADRGADGRSKVIGLGASRENFGELGISD